MQSNWFRFYEATLDNPKVQKLPDRLFKVWINLLCLASRNGGHLPANTEDVAFALRADETQMSNDIETLVERNLFDRCNGVAVPHDWDSYQYVKRPKTGKSSSDRVREHRLRKRLERENGRSKTTETENETDETQRNTVSYEDETPPDSDSDSETDSDSDTETDKNGDQTFALQPVKSHGDDVTVAVAAYNDVARRLGSVICQKITPARRKSLAARLKDCGGLTGWSLALDKAQASPFLRGEKGDFRLSIDFLVQESSFTKLMEGYYDGRASRRKDERPDAISLARSGLPLLGDDTEAGDR